MANSPSNYSPTLPRVSQIVEYFYPFVGDGVQRFHRWLEGYEVDPVDYMKEASSGGTFVHAQLENFMRGDQYTGKRYKGFIQGGIDFLEENNVKPIGMEVYIKTKEYQGTIDLIAEIGGKKWVLDWKTYGLAKHKFKIPIGDYRKPYDKLKKARLQLSLYAHAKRIKNIGVIELTESGYHFHELQLYTREEIKQMLKEFKFHYIDQL